MRILIVSESRTMHRALVKALEAEVENVKADSARNPEEALIQLVRFSYDVAVLLPVRIDAQLFTAIRGFSSHTNVMVVGLPDHTMLLLHCFRAGALNCACKDETLAEIGKKLQGTKVRKTYLSPELANALVTLLARHPLPLSFSYPGQLPGLTQREWKVLEYLEQDLSNPEIAERLSLTVGTVKNHVHHILQKLSVESRKQAAEVMRLMLDR